MSNIFIYIYYNSLV